MSNLDKTVWIDDNADRENTALGIGAVFIHVDENNIEQKFSEFSNGDEPAIVILDHFLDTGSNIYNRGSTLAEAIKGLWVSCPVVGISAGREKIDSRTRLAYDDFFDYTYFHDGIAQFVPIADGFDRIDKLAEKSGSSLIELLNPPRNEKERLLDALPEGLKSTLDAGVTSDFYRWFKQLRDRAGFLYDELWTATLIGLSEKGFLKVKKLFEEAKYTGIFCVETYTRWWSSDVTELLYRNVEPENEQFTWHLGRKLTDFADEDFSICHKCEKPFPEIVAYLDSESSDRAAMHLECTVLHPGFKKELFFEDVRVMDGD